jgi:hypothetical protein
LLFKQRYGRGSSNYRGFDSYLLPPAAVPAIAAELGIPATADEWLATRGTELDRRLKTLCPPAAVSSTRRISTDDGAVRISLKACIQLFVSSAEPAPRLWNWSSWIEACQLDLELQSRAAALAAGKRHQ